MPSATRRYSLRLALGLCGCAVCGIAGLRGMSGAAAAEPGRVEGPGYALSFVGTQREAIMGGKRAAVLNLATLRDRPRLYGLGPVEGLAGEVTIVDGRPSIARVTPGSRDAPRVEASWDVGVPFFVWAEVPGGWQEQLIPAEVRTYADLDAFMGRAGSAAGLTDDFPFRITGRPGLVDYHVVNATPDTPAGMAAHQAIQIGYELHGRDAVLVGFHTRRHQGVFVPMGSNIHVHVVAGDGAASGHVQGLEIAGGLVLGLPKPA